MNQTQIAHATVNRIAEAISDTVVITLNIPNFHLTQASKSVSFAKSMKTLTPVKHSKQVNLIDHVATGKIAMRRRKALGLSLRQASAIMGFSAPFLSDLERGRRNWNPNALEKFKLLKKA